MAEARPTEVATENIRMNIENDRDTFLPRPSDDPNDPLNWPIFLKVRASRFYLNLLLTDSGFYSNPGLPFSLHWNSQYSYH
jgi:hypothetical protein